MKPEEFFNRNRELVVTTDGSTSSYYHDFAPGDRVTFMGMMSGAGNDVTGACKKHGTDHIQWLRTCDVKPHIRKLTKFERSSLLQKRRWLQFALDYDVCKFTSDHEMRHMKSVLHPLGIRTNDELESRRSRIIEELLKVEEKLGNKASREAWPDVDPVAGFRNFLNSHPIEPVAGAARAALEEMFNLPSDKVDSKALQSIRRSKRQPRERRFGKRKARG